MSTLPTVQDLLAGGAPSAKFSEPGATHKGTITKVEATQQTDFDSGELKFWDDGRPMMQLVVTVATAERDPEIPEDDGERRIFVKGQMLQSLKAALRSVNATVIDPGDVIAVQYTGDGEAKRRGMSPPKQYAVQVKKGAGTQADLLANEPEAPQHAPQDLL